MKINIELELHPNTERPNVDLELDHKERFANATILVLCHARNFFGELYFDESGYSEDSYDPDGEAYAGNDEGYFKIPWSKVDGWIAVSELKEQVMKASGK